MAYSQPDLRLFRLANSLELPLLEGRRCYRMVLAASNFWPDALLESAPLLCCTPLLCGWYVHDILWFQPLEWGHVSVPRVDLANSSRVFLNASLYVVVFFSSFARHPLGKRAVARTCRLAC